MLKLRNISEYFQTCKVFGVVHHVLYGQGYCTPHGTVIDKYGAIVEQRLTGETEELGEEPVPVPLCPQWISVEVTKHWTHGEKLVSSLLSFGMAVKDWIILFISLAVIWTRFVPEKLFRERLFWSTVMSQYYFHQLKRDFFSSCYKIILFTSSAVIWKYCNESVLFSSIKDKRFQQLLQNTVLLWKH
jgi:hypothetical protein